MPNNQRSLTPEQELVVHHPPGYHARVLAVAGSGKSTTLAHHIKLLVDTRQAPPNAMLVLMFNAMARKQFFSHLDKVGLPSNLQPSVHTFHSFSYSVINEAIKASLLPSKTQFWLSDKAEYVWVCLKRVISDLEKAKRFPHARHQLVERFANPAQSGWFIHATSPAEGLCWLRGVPPIPGCPDL
jgi:DNA helicase-2/ATP-dependent DNA helicase PcrA